MSFFQTAISYLPSILQGIISVEQIITAPKSGTTKKALIMNTIQAAAQAGETIPNDVVAGISSLIDYSVSVLNKANVLGANGTAQAAAKTTS